MGQNNVFTKSSRFIFNFILCIIICPQFGNNSCKEKYIQSNKTCPLVEQYLGYLVVIKGRSENTILDYRINLTYVFSFCLKYP